ncbi:MAG TPA: DNA methyltransferase [Dehalococcoidia bacterium]|nr:DNA methyltransferase [Dehalococcoidia bacterium]
MSGVEEMPLARLRRWGRNPRQIRGERLEALKRSLQADREMLGARPLVALPDGRVVCGNQRLLAAQELGWQTIPTITVDLDEQRAAVWALRDNKSYGEWDETLAELLAELDAAGAELELTGFAPLELEALLAEVSSGQVVSDPEDVPPLPGEPVSRPGELYELGPHRLVCGDASDPDTLAQLVADMDAAVEVVWTDPPYGVDYEGKTKERLRIANDQPLAVEALLREVLSRVEPLLVPNSRFYICSPAAERGASFIGAISEQILYGYTPGRGRPGRGRQKGSRWYGDNAQASVFFVDRPQASREHPTIKPVELIEPMLRNSSRRGDTILDPFAGSGSTLIACERLGRRCLAVELDPAYCDVIRRRYAEYVKQPQYLP